MDWQRIANSAMSGATLAIAFAITAKVFGLWLNVEFVMRSVP
jgi:hypothetical protein